MFSDFNSLVYQLNNLKINFKHYLTDLKGIVWFHVGLFEYPFFFKAFYFKYFIMVDDIPRKARK